MRDDTKNGCVADYRQHETPDMSGILSREPEGSSFRKGHRYVLLQKQRGLFKCVMLFIWLYNVVSDFQPSSEITCNCGHV